jgi:uncharacterized membrane protein (UPF0127 family)
MADRQGLTRFVWRAAGVVLSFVLLLSLNACGNGGEKTGPSAEPLQSEPAVVETVAFPISGQTFNLELALDNESRMQGLSDRKSIEDDGGMVFKFVSPVKTQFVMRRCYVPIDLIFIDEDGYIDSLHAMEVIEPIGGARWKNPFSGYPTRGSVLYAVELQGGKIEELGLKRGEKIDLPEAVLQLKAQ